MDRAFFQAVQSPRPPALPAVLGLRLRPFTLGHALLLLEHRSPFVLEDERDFAWPDLFLAVFVCSQPQDKARRSVGAWWTSLFFALWALVLRWRRRGRGKASDEQVEALVAFWDYLKAQSVEPGLRRPLDSPPARPCTSPSYFVKFLFALQILHLTEEAARSMPMALLNCLYATWADWNGHAELADQPILNDLMAFARAEDAKRYNPDGSRKSATGTPGNN